MYLGAILFQVHDFMLFRLQFSVACNKVPTLDHANMLQSESNYIIGLL